MADKVLPELRAELGADVAGLAKLSTQEQSQLLELIQDARKRQHQGIKAAMEGALEFVPALLRGPVRAFFKHY